ncbi:hypothetical protein PSEUDO8BK_41042 [Pseudomonas sp. 8BK]|nr:hypothetical protein PSEUDO8BK_41042 [Pseudomonas sp. 8BK]
MEWIGGNAFRKAYDETSIIPQKKHARSTTGSQGLKEQ